MTYTCRYISSEIIHIDVYNIVATGFTTNSGYPKYIPDLPEAPQHLSAVFNSTTIVVYWQPGFDGGHPQRLYIEYKPETRSEWEVVGLISQSNFTIDQELKYTLNYILFAKKYYIRMYADNVVGQSNYTHLFCVDMEALNCSYNSEKHYYLVLEIISSLLGGILILSLCANICCLLTRRENSENVSENPQESQYYEIQPINDNNMNNASIQGIINYLPETETSVYRLSLQGTDSITSSFQKASSSKSSVRSLSNLLLNENEYENPYQTIDHENIEMNQYSIITSDRYQNTTVFQKDIRTNNIENDKERDPWLIIYKNA